MRRQVCGLRQHFRRALHRTRGREAEIVSASSRTVIDSDRRADRAARSKNCPGGTWSFGGRMFHVKHTSESLDIVPFICATESPPQGHGTCPVHVSASRPKTARGWLHVPLVMSESAKPREEGEPVFDTETRVLRRILFHPIKPSFSTGTKSRTRFTHWPPSPLSPRRA